MEKKFGIAALFGGPKTAPFFIIPNSPVSMSADLAGKIKQQIEYYFSGLNLKRDKFMREKMAADPEGCRRSLRCSYCSYAHCHSPHF